MGAHECEAHADALEENARLKAAWDASHKQAMKNGAACNAWRDRAERAEADLAKLKSEMASLEQSLTDPENQPSQFGTVTLEWHEAALAKLREHAEAMAESIDRTVFSTTAQQDALASYRADFPEEK